MTALSSRKPRHAVLVANSGIGRLTDRAAAWFVVALVISADFEFRRRDKDATLSGSVDFAILLELAVYLGIGAWLLVTLARAPRLRLIAQPMAALWALSGVLALSALWAPSPGLGIARSVELLVTVGLGTALAHRAGPRTWHVIAHAYTALITCGVMIGLVFRSPPQAILRGRFLWLYGHPVVAASMLVMSAIFLLAWTLDRRLPRSFPNWAYPAGFVVHTAALLATQTRGSIAAFGLGVAVLVWIRTPKARRNEFVLFALVAVPTTLVLGRGLLAAIALRGETADQLRNLNSRADLWTEAAKVIRERPLTGGGYFSSREIFLESIGLGGAHNAYIEVAVSAGMIGMVLFAWLIWSIIGSLRKIGDHPDKAVLGALMTVFAVNAVSAQYVAQAGTAANVMFIVVCAWIASLAYSTPGVASTASPASTASKAGAGAGAQLDSETWPVCPLGAVEPRSEPEPEPGRRLHTWVLVDVTALELETGELQ